MIRVLGSFFLCCIRSTEANKRVVSTRRLIAMLDADVKGKLIAASHRISLLETDYKVLATRTKALLEKQDAHAVSIGELLSHKDQHETKRGKK